MRMGTAAADTLEKVSGEFESEVLADLQEGRGQALAIVESTRKETSQAVAKILEMGVKQAESLKRQIMGTAEIEARNAQLKAMEEAVNETFSSAVDRISKASRARYEKSIAQLVKEGIEVIGARANVACNLKDRATVSSVIRKLNKGSVKLSLDEKSIDTSGGVILTTTDGSVRFDNAYEARLERMRPALRKEVADLLSGKH